MISNMSIHITRFPHAEGISLPQYQTNGSAGMDLFAAIENEITILPMQIAIVPTGFAISLPNGFEAQVRPRSGLAAKYGITIVNSPGTIDSDYRGEIKVILQNLGKENFLIKRGDRIAQMVISKYEKIEWNEVASLDDTERGAGGFGHTGVGKK
ncbi:MAG: dUTP diphosphatase [Ignavibacteriales bacterium]|nr:dUTP diphosphatase [Ignavibacteriales bacterium]